MFFTGNYWSSKWKILKDNYAKHKKSNAVSSGQSYKKYKNWPWAELMRFLDDVNKSRLTENSITQLNTSQEQINTEENVGTSSIQENSNAESHSENRRKRKATNDNNNSASQVLEYLRMKNEQKSKLDEADHFFLSYSQTFKKFPKRIQSMLKLEIATLFARYELQSDDAIQQPGENLSAQERTSSFQHPLLSPLSVSSTESPRPHSVESTTVPRVIILPNVTQEDSAASQNLSNYFETYTIE